MVPLLLLLLSSKRHPLPRIGRPRQLRCLTATGLSSSLKRSCPQPLAIQVYRQLQLQHQQRQTASCRASEIDREETGGGQPKGEALGASSLCCCLLPPYSTDLKGRPGIAAPRASRGCCFAAAAAAARPPSWQRKQRLSVCCCFLEESVFTIPGNTRRLLLLLLVLLLSGGRGCSRGRFGGGVRPAWLQQQQQQQQNLLSPLFPFNCIQKNNSLRPQPEALPLLAPWPAAAEPLLLQQERTALLQQQQAAFCRAAIAAAAAAAALGPASAAASVYSFRCRPYSPTQAEGRLSLLLLLLQQSLQQLLQQEAAALLPPLSLLLGRPARGVPSRCSSRKALPTQVPAAAAAAKAAAAAATAAAASARPSLAE
ncbi:hypothetical protein Efla_004915 [Eimeria flavescens]